MKKKNIINKKRNKNLKILSPKKKEASNKSLINKKFLEEMEVHYSPHTLSAYKRDLQIYDNFLKDHNDITFFYEYIDKKGFSVRSKARIISSIRSYFRFLESKGQNTPLRKLKTVPVESHLPKLISTTEFERIYEAAKVSDIYKTHRNQIVLLLLFGLGCRISEIIQLNLQDISEMDHSLVVTGKRKKQRMLPLTQDLFTQLNKYIKKYRPALLKTQTHSVLINNRGRRPSRVDIWRWLSSWSKKAGFEEVKNPHQFRHGFATSLLENGADLRSIQFLLGHSSIQTTQIYTSVKQKHLKKTIKKHHPLSNFNPKKIRSTE